MGKPVFRNQYIKLPTMLTALYTYDPQHGDQVHSWFEPFVISLQIQMTNSSSFLTALSSLYMH